MRKGLTKLHKGQQGIGLIAIAIILALAAGTWFGGNYFLQNTGIGQDLVSIFRGDDPDIPAGTDAEPILSSYTETWACWESASGTDINSYRYIVWNCTNTGQITSLGYRVGRSASGTRYTEGRVYLWDAVNTQLGPLVGAGSHVPYMELGYRHYGPSLPQPIAYYYFDETPVTLYSGLTYAVGIASVGGSGDLWFNLPNAGAACMDVVGVYQPSTDTLWSGANYGHAVSEMVLTDPTVVTSGSTLLDDGTVRLEGWAEVVGTMDCGFYYGTNETLVTSSNSTRVVVDTSAADDVRFGFTHELADVQNGVTYYYKAFSEIIGLEFYGSVLNFTRYAWEIPVTLQCELIQNDREAIMFETRLVGSNASIAYNITLDYGSTYDLMLDQDGQATVVLNTTDDGYWRNTFAVNQTFDAGSTYWFRATAVGNDTSIAHSTPDSFVPWDPNQPPIINEIIIWLQEHGWGSHSVDELWWVIFFAGLALCWILAGVLKWKWLGIIGTAALLIALIHFGMAPVWLVILLVLVAGWIIFKLVWTRAHEETGD